MEVGSGRLHGNLAALHAQREASDKVATHDTVKEQRAFAQVLQEQTLLHSSRKAHDTVRTSRVSSARPGKRRRADLDDAGADLAEAQEAALGEGTYTAKRLAQTQSALVVTMGGLGQRDRGGDDDEAEI